MTIELSVLIPIGFTTLSGIAIYLFTLAMSHEKRIQKIEDIQGSRVDHLENQIIKLEAKIDTLQTTVTDLSYNIHKANNKEQIFNSTLEAVLKHLNRE